MQNIIGRYVLPGEAGTFRRTKPAVKEVHACAEIQHHLLGVTLALAEEKCKTALCKVIPKSVVCLIAVQSACWQGKIKELDLQDTRNWYSCPSYRFYITVLKFITFPT